MFEAGDASNRWKIKVCSSQQVLQENLSWFLSLTQENVFSQRFYFKPTKRTYVLLRNGTRDFQNSPPLWKTGMLLCDGHWKFRTSSVLWLKQTEMNFLKRENFFKKLENRFFSFKYRDWKCNISIQNSHARSHYLDK